MTSQSTDRLRTPEQIIGHDALMQLVFEGYEVRRSAPDLPRHAGSERLPPFPSGDIVETIKGAEFWGEVVSTYDLGPEDGWRVDVRATAPGFRRTIHIYPAVQLGHRADSAQPALRELPHLVGEWQEARRTFIALPAGDPNAREALNKLSEAEDNLANARQLQITDGTEASRASLLGVIADIREKSGLGAKPMLSELAGAIEAALAAARHQAIEECRDRLSDLALEDERRAENASGSGNTAGVTVSTNRAEGVRDAIRALADLVAKTPSGVSE